MNLDKLEDIQDIKYINLENKNIIITGATGGIGFSLVDTLVSFKAIFVSGTNEKIERT